MQVNFGFTVLKELFEVETELLHTLHISGSPVVTIEYFAHQLVVITSKQRPRKLTIRGSDGEDYAFLLKGHEDLRQDERVMQVSYYILG